MATYKHLRSSTANKRPTTSITDGQLAINTNTASPGLFFKDSAGTGIVKVGPVHVGTTAPNATPAAGGSSGNYLGEQWLDTSVSPAQMKVWNGSAWVGIVADELPVSKLQDGDARQLLQTDAAGTGVEWTSNVDVPGTLDVTSTATFDSIARHPLGSAAAPTLTFTGDPNTGIYSPGADQVAVATNGTGRVFVDASGNVGVKGSTVITTSAVSAPTFQIGDGAGSPAVVMYSAAVGQSQISFADSTTGTGSYDGYILYNQSSQYLSLGTAATERLRITSAGLVGIGTSAPGVALHIAASTTGAPLLRLTDNSGVGGGSRGSSIDLQGISNDTGNVATTFARIYGLKTNNTQGNTQGFFRIDTDNGSGLQTALTIDSSQRVGIGTTSPAAQLNVSQSTGSSIVKLNGLNGYDLLVSNTQDSGTLYDFNIGSGSGAFSFTTSAGERARIDSSGRLLVGTSTARDNFFNTSGLGGLLQVEGANNNARRVISHVYGVTGPGGPILALGKHRSNSVGDNTVVQSGDECGILSFLGSDGTEFVEAAQIRAEADGTPGANDMPGRLVFSTTADGASSPTERMRIGADGLIQAYGLGNSIIAASAQAAGTTFAGRPEGSSSP
jgi:hypothetical protein